MSNPIEMKPVVSSNISAIGYDEATERLRIRFGSKPLIYEYAKVPKAKFDALMASESKGSHFFKEIKGKHDFIPIAPVATGQSTDASTSTPKT